MFVVSILAQLFAETSLCTLTSLSSTLSPVLSKLLPLVEQHHHTSDPLSHAAHTLTLPLLNVILTKSRGCSHDLKESAVHILCNSVSKFVSSLESDSQALKVRPHTDCTLCTVTVRNVQVKKSLHSLASFVSFFVPFFPLPKPSCSCVREACDVDPLHYTVTVFSPHCSPSQQLRR